LPFDQLATRLAPWRLLEAARARGADPIEVLLAAEIFGHVLAAEKIEEPDPGSILTVDRAEKNLTPFVISVQPRPCSEEQGDPIAALRAAFDIDARAKTHRRAVETAITRIDEARKSGASLYLTDVAAVDIELVVQHAPGMLDRWLEGHRECTTDFRRRVRLAEAAFLSLCEALLIHDPARGAELWRALRVSMATTYLGAAGIDELLHTAFRVPDSTPVAQLRDEIIGLHRCHTDQDLFNVAVAAAYNGQAAWLAAVATDDLASPQVWRQRRGVLLAGLSTGNALPITDAWPEERNPNGSRRAPSQSRSLPLERSLCTSLMASISCRAGCDRRLCGLGSISALGGCGWTWMREEVAAHANDDFSKLKLAHAQLNRSELRRAMEKRVEKLDKKFLDYDIVDGVGPWGKVSDVA